MSRLITTLTGEGFVSRITEESDGRVRFPADADINADGANGQHGRIAAYRTDGHGSEALANGGMELREGKVRFAASWGRDIAVADDEGNPLALGGNIVSKTAYHFHGVDLNLPSAYVDSETVCVVTVPPQIIRGVRGIVLGCQAFATYQGKRIAAMVGDVGPRTKCGEISIELARRLGIPSSPRTGGLDRPLVTYELFPDVPAVVDGVTYVLQAS